MSWLRALNPTAGNKLVIALGLLCGLAHFSMGQAINPRPEEILLAERLSELSVQLPSEIKKLDRGTLRVFLRLRLASLLWLERDPKLAGSASALTIGGLEDLDAEKDRIPELYATTFRRDLVALLEAHAPDLAKRYKDTNKEESFRNTVDSAYSLLETKGQEDSAISLLKKGISEGQIAGVNADWATIVFFLTRVQKEYPERLPDLLLTLLAAEERNPESISIRGLFFIADFYLNDNTPIELKRRFVAVSITVTARSYLLANADELTDAYDLLRIVLPLAPSLTPNLYSQASAQMSSLMTRISRRREREEIEARIEASDDPLATTISEANAARDVALKDDLFSEAAQNARSAGKLELALEAAMSISSEGKHQWRDQFLGELAESAIDKRDPEFAATVISKIDARSRRAAALQALSLYFQNSGDPTKAIEVFSEELKIIDSTDDKSERAVAFLKTLPVFLRLNGSPISNFTERAVKYVNAIPVSGNETDRGAADRYVADTLMPVAWQLLPNFQLLSERDESTALAVIDQIQHPGLRLVARLGLCEGRLKLVKANMASPKENNTDVKQKRN
jgi:hypothetical protein